MHALLRPIRTVIPMLALFSGAAALVAFGGSDAPAAARPLAPVSLAPFAGQGIRLVTAPDGNEARYRVREQLARIEFPSDAVGSTSNVTGVIVIDAQGRIARGDSRFTVDLASISTDSDRRDNYVRRNTLRTEQHPEAVFVPTSFEGLPSPLPTTGELAFRLVGDLTLNGNTRPVTWQVSARAAGGAYTGTARTEFNFSYFGIPVPRVASVLSVTETVRLEYDFRLVPQ